MAAPRQDRRTHLRSPAALAIAAAAAVHAYGSGVLSGLSPRSASAQTGAQPDVSGLGFGDLKYPGPAVRGKLAFAGTHVASWREGSTDRLVLRGDVRVTIGEYQFRAKHAAAWLQDRGDGAKQVFVYVSGIRNAESAVGGVGVDTDALPVRGVIIPDGSSLPGGGGGVEIQADSLVTARPQKSTAWPAIDESLAFVDLAEGQFARSMATLRGERAATDSLPPLPKFTPRSTFPPRVVKVTPPKPDSPRATNQTQGARGGARPEDRPTDRPVDRVAQQPNQRPAQGAGNAAAAGAGPTTQNTQGQNTQAQNTQAAQGSQSNGGRATGSAATGPVGAAPTQAATVPGGAAGSGGAAIIPREGTLVIAPGDVTVITGTDENAVVASKGVSMQYVSAKEDRVLQMTAQRAVVFMEPGELADMFTLGADRVRGIYLEGDVTASDGQFTIRGPQVYYDLRANRAMMPDAVLHTYDQTRGVPLYIRAKALRQESPTGYSLENARITNSAFFDPELSVGASRITVSRVPGQVAEAQAEVEEGEAPARIQDRTWVRADDITVRAMGVPVMYWPRYSGDPEERLIKDIRIENRSGSGAGVLSTLNAYALLGMQSPSNVSADLLADYYFERGPAIGTRIGWSGPRSEGGLFAYMVPFDSGTDVMKPGTKIDRDDEFRGVITGEQRSQIDSVWSVQAEWAFLSDEALVDAFFEQLGETRREFTNRIRAKRMENNTLLSIEAKGSFNDFLSNEYLLQSPGYSVARLPEVIYTRIADDLLPDVSPGWLTWSSDSRIGLIEMQFDESEAREHGFTTDTLAQKALGINASQRLGDVLRGQGLTGTPIFRADTRHEVSMQAQAGPVRIQPYVVARATAYDDSFEQFSPDEDDRLRLFGGGGVRLSTTISRVLDDADSRLFDVHRLRHVMEPNITIWAGGTSVESSDLPIYDSEVEALTDGLVVKLGLNQVLQTYRGGPGRWHTVDLLQLNTEIVISDDEAGEKAPIGRYFDFRPERTAAGDYFLADMAFRLTDATSITASTVYDFDSAQQDSSSIGLLVSHAPGFVSLVDLRYINPQDSTYLSLGTSFDLTSKYSIAAGANYDFDESKFQTVGVDLRRRFSSVMIGVNASYNEITSETSFGFVIRPFGAVGGVGATGVGGDSTGLLNRFRQ